LVIYIALWVTEMHPHIVLLAEVHRLITGFACCHRRERESDDSFSRNTPLVTKWL